MKSENLKTIAIVSGCIAVVSAGLAFWSSKKDQKEAEMISEYDEDEEVADPTTPEI